jgi:hypothetical protein
MGAQIPGRLLLAGKETEQRRCRRKWHEGIGQKQIDSTRETETNIEARNPFG